MIVSEKRAVNWLTRTAHLMLILAVLPLLLTGLRIAVAHEPSLVRLSMLLPQGDMHSWHLRFAALFSLGILLYVIARLHRQSPRNKNHPNVAFRLFQLSHYVGWALMAISLLTGATLLSGLSLWPIEITLTIHLFSAFGFILYLLLHTLLAFLALPWKHALQVFNLVSEHWQNALVTVVVSLMIVIALAWVLTRPLTLDLPYTTSVIELDGDLRETAWQQADSITITTYQGYAQPIKGTEVTLKALRDDNFAYFYISWPDKTRSQVHVPLVKTNEGWQVVQTALGEANENVFYEDKMAIMLSESDQLAGAGTVQLGHHPLKNQPPPLNDRGLHYTTDNSLADVWHWKSVRTGLSLGQADDNFFGPPSPSDSEYKRFTGGYHKDRDDCEHLIRWDGADFQTKDECGGYVMNWRLYNDDVIVPIRMPKSPELLKRVATFDRDPNTSDFGAWWLSWDDTVAYDPDDDVYPIGTVIPSVLTLGPFSQGRGDVTTVGYWRDGRWQLEMKRALDTGSEFDLPIKDGVHLWVSTFDHAQTRHSYHLKPIRLQF